MKNFISFLKAELDKGVESKIINTISNEIILKNKSSSSMDLSSKCLNYLFSLAKENFLDEVENTPFAKDFFNNPLSSLECSISSCLKNKSKSVKMASIDVLNTFVENLNDSIKEYQEIYS